MTQPQWPISDVEEARATVAAAVLPPWRQGEVDLKVGVEAELLPVLVGPGGEPAGRLPLHGPDGTLARLQSARGGRWHSAGVPGGSPELELTDGGRITFEPGGQIEHSSQVHASAAAVMADFNRTLTAVREALSYGDVALAAAGADPWFGPDEVPMQLDAPRYRAMAAYFERRGPAGAVMMRCTTSTQINLDLGPGGVRTERYSLASLISPLITATFTSSPGHGVRSRRARTWQELDPTRTGFPKALERGHTLSPEEVYAEAALDADVLLFRTPDGDAEPGEPGFRFQDWIESGHPRFGRPTKDDLLYHLTTLFFEVRVRGVLELRSPDALPAPWSGVPLVLVSGLLYDPRARAEALALLGALGPRLDELWRRAAAVGLRDPEIASLAGRAWEIAIRGAERLPTGWLGEGELQLADQFLERFTARRLAPADELEEALAEGPAASLSWTTGRIARILHHRSQ